MSVGDFQQGVTGGLTRPERPPLWTIGLSAFLVAVGFGRRRSQAPVRAKDRSEQFDDGRGRAATAPSEIPARGWKDIVLRVYEGISDDRILANSAAVTFYALLALFPAIAALVSIYGLVADPNTMAKSLDDMSAVLPGGAIDVVRDQLTRLTAQGSATLGISFVIGLAVSLWSANGGIKALFDTLNVV